MSHIYNAKIPHLLYVACHFRASAQGLLADYAGKKGEAGMPVAFP